MSQIYITILLENLFRFYPQSYLRSSNFLKYIYK
jgi:hypothetical protein